MRFKLIPRRSETLPLPPLLGHAALMAAVPLLAHTMQTHSLSLSLQRGWFLVVFFLPCNIKKSGGVSKLQPRFRLHHSFVSRYVLSNASTAAWTGLNFMLGFKRARCRALTLSNLFEISALAMMRLLCSFCLSFGSCTERVGLRCSSELVVLHVLHVLVTAT